MGSDVLPYFLLLLSIIAGWRFDTRISMIILSAAIVAGLFIGRLTPVALISIGLLGLSIWLPARLNLRIFWRGVGFGTFLILAVAMSNHLVPGFNNLPIFQGTRFSADSVPFTMYLNFDKTLVGLFIYVFFLKPNQSAVFGKEQLVASGKTLGLLVVLIVPIAVAIQYVRIDIKLPEFAWIWMINNLFFVCLAEEGLFRGIIQKGLSQILRKTKAGSVASIALAALSFGFAHYRGGISYIVFATTAGVFYGFVFQRTNRLESSILVHFGLNTVHFIFFSYPALIR